MKQILIFIIGIALTAAISSCGHDNSHNNNGEMLPTRPGEPTQAEFDFSKELSDYETRFISPTLSMRYNNGGIIARIDRSETTEIKMTDLTNGHEVKFSGTGLDKKGAIGNPSLTVNGNMLTISSATLEDINKKGVWIHLQTPERNNFVLVITDL